MSALAAQLVVLLPPPIRPDTVAGYVQFRGFNSLAILFAVWALASATGFARADEEKGLVESELATGTSRVALVGSRVLAFAIGLAVAAAMAGMAFVLGVASGNESFERGRVVEAAANLVALGLACYGISLLVSQLTAARFATAAAGAVLLALFFLNSLSRVFSWLSTWRWLSPFRYYDLSQPLPQGGQLDVRAFLVLLGIALVASSAAAFAFWRRDLGGALVRVPMRAGPPRYEPSTSPWWRYPVLRGVYERRLGVLAWSAGVAALAVLFVSLTRTIVNVLLNIPALLPYLSIFVHQQLYPAVLGYTWLNVAQLLFAGLAITHVARWSAEDSDGRLEMALSAPYSRAAVVVERMAVLVAVALVVAAVSGLTLYYASHANGRHRPQRPALDCRVADAGPLRAGVRGRRRAAGQLEPARHRRPAGRLRVRELPRHRAGARLQAASLAPGLVRVQALRHAAGDGRRVAQRDPHAPARGRGSRKLDTLDAEAGRRPLTRAAYQR
ncbi:MAG: hypothetical protein E6I92_01420 [Chloroflexi bacterium]|nr:MAG: hypothetical protein E6I92_01420 [Chloroflexota bacterium]